MFGSIIESKEFKELGKEIDERRRVQGIITGEIMGKFKEDNLSVWEIEEVISMIQNRVKNEAHL
jgi:hypothetical protein